MYHTWGAHTYQKGLNAVLALLYKDTNKRTTTLDEYKQVVRDYFILVDSKYKSGHHYITPITKSRQHAGWIVDFSDKLLWLNGQKLTKINDKSFLFTTYGSSNKALEAAISNRDTIFLLTFKRIF